MFQRLLQSKIFTILSGLLLLLLAFNILKAWLPLKQLEKEVANIKNKIMEARRKNVETVKKMEYLNSEAYLERQVRAQLNYKNPDEEVVLVYRSKPASASDDTNSDSSIESSGLFARMFNWLQNVFK